MRPSQVFAARVQKVRTHKGWSQQDLADRVQMNRVTIARIETEKRNVMLDEFLTISAALGVAPVHMLVHVDQEDPIDVAPHLDPKLQPVEPTRARQWIRGERKLPGGDDRMFRLEIPDEDLRLQDAIFEDLEQRVDLLRAELRTETIQWVQQEMGDHFQALARQWGKEFAGKVREEVSEQTRREEQE